MPKTEKTRINIEEEITRMYQFYQIRRGMYIRKNKSNVCPAPIPCFTNRQAMRFPFLLLR